VTGWCRVCGLEYACYRDWLLHRYEHEHDRPASPSWNDRVALLPRPPRGRRATPEHDDAA
jgi:hypothetical protein